MSSYRRFSTINTNTSLQEQVLRAWPYDFMTLKNKTSDVEHRVNEAAAVPAPVSASEAITIPGANRSTRFQFRFQLDNLPSVLNTDSPTHQKYSEKSVAVWVVISCGPGGHEMNKKERRRNLFMEVSQREISTTGYTSTILPSAGTFFLNTSSVRPSRQVMDRRHTVRY